MILDIEQKHTKKHHEDRRENSMKTESKIRNKKYGNCKNSVVVVLIMVIIKMTVVTILMMMMMILDDHRQHYYVCTSVHFGDRYSVNSYRLQNAVDVAFQ